MEYSVSYKRHPNFAQQLRGARMLAGFLRPLARTFVDFVIISDMSVWLVFVLLASAAAFNLPNSPQPVRKPAASQSSRKSITAQSDSVVESDEHCLVDEPVVECFVRNQVDGPWADVWARYVLLRPGMSYTELKRATLQRNQLDPTSRIPGTYRTVVIAHLLCFAAALPAVITSPAVFPKVLVAATASRVAAGI